LINVLRAAQAAGPPPVPVPDTVPPTATITAPMAGAFVRGSTTINAAATDNVAVQRVEFFDGATLLGTDFSAPYSLAWNTFPAAPGAHTLTVTAYDAAGSSDSDSRGVTVDNIAPTAVVTNPSNAAIVSGSVAIAANTTDPAPASGVRKVVFLVDGTAVGSDGSPPYSIAWNSATVADGTHTIRAKATDRAGNVALSSAVSVTVANAATVQLHVQSLTGTPRPGAPSWKASATVGIADQNGLSTQGATVTFSVTGGASGTLSCVTASGGVCTTARVTVPDSAATVTFTVTGVTKPGATWDGVPASVVVNRPT